MSGEYVILFKGVVVKYPRSINPGYFKVWTKDPAYVTKHILKSIQHNWSEFIFSCTHKTPFILKTYFSFFGIFNIQKFGKDLHPDNHRMNAQLTALTGDAIWELEDGHTFGNPENFCDSSGFLKIRDYGSKKTQKIIKQYGDKLHKKYRLITQKAKTAKSK